jgi:hypothetical protein
MYHVPPGPSRQIELSWFVWDLGDGALVMQPWLAHTYTQQNNNNKTGEKRERITHP